MVGVNHRGMELRNRSCGLFGRHRVGQIHANKRFIDILQGQYFRNGLCVTRKIQSFSTVRQHVAVTTTFIVIELTGGGSTGEVVGCDGRDGPVAPVFRFTIGDDGVNFGLRSYGSRSPNDGAGLSELIDVGCGKVIAVDIGDDDEICGRQTVIGALSGSI